MVYGLDLSSRLAFVGDFSLTAVAGPRRHFLVGDFLAEKLLYDGNSAQFFGILISDNDFGYGENFCKCVVN